jgi:hypothetical protein
MLVLHFILRDIGSGVEKWGVGSENRRSGGQANL